MCSAITSEAAYPALEQPGMREGSPEKGVHARMYILPKKHLLMRVHVWLLVASSSKEEEESAARRCAGLSGITSRVNGE